MLTSLSWELDGWIILTGVLCALSASLLGNFLVLRRMSLLGDAISHAILPGLAAAFLFTGSRQSLPMFIGAVAVGIATSWLTQWTKSAGKMDESAAIGVVFTGLFALGLVMIVQAADKVDLDPGCVLYGSIETTPLDTLRIGNWNIPRVVLVLAVVLAINLLFVICCYKELKVTTFDPGLANSLGISSSLFHYLLASLVAVTSVASFESVGNILVVAMFIVPPATALLLTERLSVMIVVSAIVAALSAVLGHLAAVELPHLVGMESVSTAGMMSLTSGLILAVAVLLSPKVGLIPVALGRWLLAQRILSEDIIARLFRQEELKSEAIPYSKLRQSLLASQWSLRSALSWLCWRGYVRLSGSAYQLTDKGRAIGQNLVRSHRLWEQYLSLEVGIAADSLHQQAERLEHYTGRDLREELVRETRAPALDPHGRPIPPEREK